MLQEACGFKIHSGYSVGDGLKSETGVEGRKSTRRDKSRKDKTNSRLRFVWMWKKTDENGLQGDSEV